MPRKTRSPWCCRRRFPDLLANGATGIAVGMATSIPPHNVAELIDAARLLIEKPKATTAELMEFVQGPDFPTGGVIVEERAAMLDAYETGRGSFRLRARWQVEDTRSRHLADHRHRDSRIRCKSRSCSRDSPNCSKRRRSPLLEDVRDESAEDVRHGAGAAIAQDGRAGRDDGEPVQAVRS